MHLTSSVAVERHGDHVGAMPVVCKNSCTPSGSTGNNCKTSNKRTHVDSPLGSVSSDQTQLSKLTRLGCEYKKANLDMKHKKMELAAEEQLLGIKQKMQEDELMSKEQILCMELKIAQLRGGQAAVASGAHPAGLAQEGHSTDAYINNFSQPSFTFGIHATSTLPSLPSADWSFPRASTS